MWAEFVANFERWFKICCYLAFGWVFLDVLPLLPVYIVDRLIEAALRKLGL